MFPYMYTVYFDYMHLLCYFLMFLLALNNFSNCFYYNIHTCISVLHHPLFPSPLLPPKQSPFYIHDLF
jgi:hypothetical protein